MTKEMKLLQLIESKKANWDERSQFKIGKVGNLSVSDLDTIELYVKEYVASRGLDFGGMMDPMGEIKEVLDAYGVKPRMLLF